MHTSQFIANPWPALSGLHELQEHLSLSDKVSGKQVQTRAKPPAVCSALWLSPEALVQLCCTSWWAGHLRGESGTVLLAVTVGRCSVENKQEGKCCTKATLTAFPAVFTTGLGWLLPQNI